MKHQFAALLCAGTALLGANAATAAAEPAAERVYILDCGSLSAPDKSLWTPGKNQGVAVTLAENCYLVRHKDGLLLWDTGIADSLTGKSVTTHGMTLSRRESLIAELKAIGVDPGQIRYVATSHTHPDHTGNLDLFPQAQLLIQQAELDWSAKAGFLTLPQGRPVLPLSGDHDVFGDGAVRIIATPGHTPGHQSLVVHLAKTGWVILGGDVAHLQENYDNDIAPGLNVDAAATHRSIARVKALQKALKAQVWINHDPDQIKGLQRSPKFYR